MEKITSRKKLLLYGCSGLGVNMLNIIVGSYLCSALMTGGYLTTRGRQVADDLKLINGLADF